MLRERRRGRRGRRTELDARLEARLAARQHRDDGRVRPPAVTAGVPTLEGDDLGVVDAFVALGIGHLTRRAAGLLRGLQVRLAEARPAGAVRERAAVGELPGQENRLDAVHALLTAGEARRTADRIDVPTREARGDEVRPALADARPEVRPCVLGTRDVRLHGRQAAACQHDRGAQGEYTREPSHDHPPSVGSGRWSGPFTVIVKSRKNLSRAVTGIEDTIEDRRRRRRCRVPGCGRRHRPAVLRCRRRREDVHAAAHEQPGQALDEAITGLRAGVHRMIDQGGDVAQLSPETTPAALVHAARQPLETLLGLAAELWVAGAGLARTVTGHATAARTERRHAAAVVSRRARVVVVAGLAPRLEAVRRAVAREAVARLRDVARGGGWPAHGAGGGDHAAACRVAATRLTGTVAWEQVTGNADVARAGAVIACRARVAVVA